MLCIMLGVYCCIFEVVIVCGFVVLCVLLCKLKVCMLMIVVCYVLF